MDDLYPRAKFADGLKIIEKLGHSKRMQIMRRQWIDEGKPRMHSYDDAEISNVEETQPHIQEDVSSDQNPVTENMGPTGDLTDRTGEKGVGDLEGQQLSIFGGDRPNTTPLNEGALFVEDETVQAQLEATGEDVPEEDDLDALLAEQNIAPENSSNKGETEIGTAVDNDHQDEFEAMEEFGF